MALTQTQADNRYDDAPYTEMGPSLLAMQPVTFKDRPDEDEDADWGDVVFNYCESRMASLRNWRWSWWNAWSTLAAFFLPKRWIWLPVANRMWRGQPLNDQIIDSTGGLAVRTCASGMWTGLTSPSRPWFKLGIALPWIKLDADGQAWLEDTEQRVYTVLAQSNFYTTMAQAFQDVTVIGTAPVIIYEDAEDVIRCYLPVAGEYYLAVGARFAVTTMIREFCLTVQQIVDMFTIDNCPQQITNLWAQGGASLDMEFVVGHMVEPNFAINRRGADRSRQAVRVVPGSFVYKEIYWLKGIKTARPLSVRGFMEQPFFAARWSTVSNDAYGRSPCMDAIGDQKQIQQETLRKAEYIEKGVRPPMGANVELKNEPASIIPAQITYMNTEGGRKGFFPLFEVSPQWIPALTADIEKVSQRIDRCLFVDLFMAISRMEGVQPRNELELTKRDLERLQELGPFVELFENEFAGPAIRRVLAILQRRKMLLPMPKSLQGVPIKINYLSILKIAQKNAEAVAMKDVFGTMGELSSAAKAAGVPDPIRVFNLDKSARRYAEVANYPTELLFTDDEVAEHDKARDKAQQDARMPGDAAAAVDAAKTLSDTKIQGGTALNALIGGPGTPGI